MHGACASLMDEASNVCVCEREKIEAWIEIPESMLLQVQPCLE